MANSALDTSFTEMIQPTFNMLYKPILNLASDIILDDNATLMDPTNAGDNA